MRLLVITATIENSGVYLNHLFRHSISCIFQPGKGRYFSCACLAGTRHKAMVVQQAHVKREREGQHRQRIRGFASVSRLQARHRREHGKLANVIHLYLLLWKVGFPSPGLRMELEMVDETDKRVTDDGRLGVEGEGRSRATWRWATVSVDSRRRWGYFKVEVCLFLASIRYVSGVGTQVFWTMTSNNKFGTRDDLFACICKVALDTCPGLHNAILCPLLRSLSSSRWCGTIWSYLTVELDAEVPNTNVIYSSLFVITFIIWIN